MHRTLIVNLQCSPKTRIRKAFAGVMSIQNVSVYVSWVLRKDSTPTVELDGIEHFRTRHKDGNQCIFCHLTGQDVKAREELTINISRSSKVYGHAYL